MSSHSSAQKIKKTVSKLSSTYGLVLKNIGKNDVKHERDAKLKDLIYF